MSQKPERFQKYLNMYHKMVLKNIKNLVGYDVAEDVTQDAFLRLYEHLDYLKEDDVKPWLLVVSANMARDYLKKNKKFEMLSLNGEMEEEAKESTEELIEESLEDTIIRRQTQEAARELLRTACDLLYEKNPVWCYILIDSNMLEMSSKQIAEVLNMSVSRINVERMRARNFLRKKLGKQFEDIF